mmetsp:Transcript_20729/g.45133  ORF Transcript_20729/g.45133 Transcript_20729/m.45133 type:complete len:991 (+) Transcript_20729:203-3175(+)|eukprot:CAMPEP_0168174254 /NCGR_PEP_ID=MMETSP0139_2-20121125/6388_1 /TAXON_ID=44445 /ORGANISM="Pseudo-nitzschia australis, Strain 10249 10 AB" /LENGTH=990 /DNA_ID=CAMNT_0008092357 /DNA_START=201 /DNA_END=3173 /DNA_ORIENTATION=-
MEQNNDESEPFTSPYQRSPRPQFNYFYGSTTTTPPTSAHTDEQDSLVGEELVTTDNECDIQTTGDDETYQQELCVRKHPSTTSPSAIEEPSNVFVSCNPVMAFVLIMGAVAIVVVLLIPPQQKSVPFLSQSFDMPFPRVDRADFGDPVEGFIDIDLFSPHLVRDASIATLPTSSDGNNDQARSSRSFSHPFPTGAFWTNLVVDPPQGSETSYPIAVYPFAYRWSSSSLRVSYPAAHRLVESKSIRDSFIPEMTFTTKEEITKRQIVDYDPLSVSLEFLSSSSENSKWETSLVQGSPYITIAYTKQTPVLKPLSIFSDVQCPGHDDEDFTDLIGENEDKDGRNFFGVCSIDKSDPKQISMRGVQFVFKTPEGVSWFMFASEPMNLVFDKITKTTISTAAPITGVIRLTYIPKNDEGKSVKTSTGVKRLIYHSDIYPIGGDISYEFHRSGSSSSSSSSHIEHSVEAAKSHATVTFKYETRSMISNTASTQTSKNLLMLALPHHVEVISESDTLTGVHFDVNYKCIKGPMTPVVGSTWTFDEPLYDMEFDAPIQKVDENIRELILKQVEDDLNQVLPTLSENVYGYGKQVARLAQLVHIADQLETNNEKGGNITIGEEGTSTLSKAAMQLSKYLEKYLSSEVSDVLVFDTNIGGICSKNGLLDKGEDFGNGRYNDHHFHYGYFLYASAVMAKIDPTFIDRFGAHVDALFHDIAYSSNGSSRRAEPDSPFFPMSRHKSWFDGHSFATGLFSFGNGKSQESSSEAVNCYYGAYLWSLIRHEEIASEVTDFSRLLLSTEIRSTKTYWHMLPQSVTGNSTNFHPHLYPSTFEENYMVGNVGMLDVTANTWFGNDPLYVHMINVIPITAVSNLLFGEDYVKYEYPFLMSGRGGVEMAWRGYTVSIHSMIDPNKAWEDGNALVSNQLDAALSKSQVLYFISQRPGFNITLDDEKKMDGGSKSPSQSASSCESNPGCAGLNLAGECCPTISGVFLGCCDK